MAGIDWLASAPTRPLDGLDAIGERLRLLSEIESAGPFKNAKRKTSLLARLEESKKQLDAVNLDVDAASAIFACTVYLTESELDQAWTLATDQLLHHVGAKDGEELINQCAIFQMEGEDHIHNFAEANGFQGRLEPERFQPYNTVNELEKLREEFQSGSSQAWDEHERTVLKRFLEKDKWVLVWDLTLSGKTVAKEMKRLRRYSQILPVRQPIKLYFCTQVLTEHASDLLQLNSSVAFQCATGITIDSSYRITSDTNPLLSTEWLQRARAFCRKFFDQFVKASKEKSLQSYCEKNGDQFGYASGAWTLVTQRNCPNNSVPVLWVNAPGEYNGPYPRLLSRISHLSLAPRELDNVSDVEVNRQRTQVQTYYYARGLRNQKLSPAKLSEQAEEHLLDQIVSDVVSKEEGRRIEAEQIVTRLATVATESRLFWGGLLVHIDKLLLQKERNLRQIERLIRCAVPVFDKNPDEFFISDRKKELLWQLSKMRIANHKGDISSVRKILKHMRKLEGTIESEDPSLALYSALNRAVTATNLFDFDKAQEVLKGWSENPRLIGIHASQRGALWSSFGQVYAFKGDTKKAAEMFDKAIEEFSGLTNLSDRNAEVDQTSVYRAINAIDLRDQHARTLVEEVLGNLELAPQKLSGAIERPYHHHLFLRYLASSSDEGELIKTYLSLQAAWSDGEHHPYELINFYRSLLLLQAGNEDLARKFMRKAIDQSLNSERGETLHFIGLAMATVGHHLGIFDLPGDKYEARVERLRNSLPKARKRLHIIKKLLAAESTPTLTHHFSSLLPFNFR